MQRVLLEVIAGALAFPNMVREGELSIKGGSRRGSLTKDHQGTVARLKHHTSGNNEYKQPE